MNYSFNYIKRRGGKGLTDNPFKFRYKLVNNAFVADVPNLELKKGSIVLVVNGRTHGHFLVGGTKAIYLGYNICYGLCRWGEGEAYSTQSNVPISDILVLPDDTVVPEELKKYESHI